VVVAGIGFPHARLPEDLSQIRTAVVVVVHPAISRRGDALGKYPARPSPRTWQV
jgi:hypothetical protein